MNIPYPRDYHRTVGAHFRTSSGRVEKVLVLLIESGFVYCMLWVIASWSLSMAQSHTQNTKWHALQTLYMLSAFSILPGSGSYVVNMVMLYISVRIWKTFVQVLNCPYFVFRARILLLLTC
jgi:hypothetical protein